MNLKNVAEHCTKYPKNIKEHNLEVQLVNSAAADDDEKTEDEEELKEIWRVTCNHQSSDVFRRTCEKDNAIKGRNSRYSHLRLSCGLRCGPPGCSLTHSAFPSRSAGGVVEGAKNPPFGHSIYHVERDLPQSHTLIRQISFTSPDPKPGRRVAHPAEDYPLEFLCPAPGSEPPCLPTESQESQHPLIHPLLFTSSVQASAS
ncbi:uncharacterized [Tachysurus ichikawai]